VELVRAILLPTSELITLDLPTFDRPRNAISGKSGTGNWLASVTAIMNRASTRMKTVSRFCFGLSSKYLK
jgi:hypothetical protein